MLQILAELCFMTISKMKLLLVFALFPLFGMSQSADSLTVHRIYIKGNDRTWSRIIVRELTLKEEYKFAKKDTTFLLNKDRQKVFNLNLFISVKVSLFNITATQADVFIEVKERWYYIVLPTFRLADRSFNEWWYERNRDLQRTIYGVYFDNINLTGNGDRLRLKFEAGFIPYYEISYNSRYIDKKQRIGLTSGIYYSTQRSIPFRTWNDKLDFLVSDEVSRRKKGGYLLFNYRKNFYLTHSLQLGYEKLSIADTVSLLNPNYFINQQSSQRFAYIDYHFLYDNRDNRQYALKGDILYFGISKYGILKSDDIRQVNISGVFSKFIPLGNKFYSNFSFRFNAGFSPNWSYPNTIKLGYRNDLVRGYELNVIDGQAYGLLKSNFKYQWLKKTLNLSPVVKIKQFNTLPLASYLNIFADAGYMKNRFPQLSNTQLGNKLLLGGGVGLDIISWYDFVGQINYSINQNHEKRFYFSALKYF